MTQADEAAVRREREGWKAAFESGDVDRIMAFYAPGAETVAFDVLPPLRFDGERAYREEWTKFLGMFDGGVSVEVSQVTVTASAEVAFVHGLCHISGVLRSGGTRDLWMRATNEAYSRARGDELPQ